MREWSTKNVDKRGKIKCVTEGKGIVIWKIKVRWQMMERCLRCTKSHDVFSAQVRDEIKIRSHACTASSGDVERSCGDGWLSNKSGIFGIWVEMRWSTAKTIDETKKENNRIFLSFFSLPSVSNSMPSILHYSYIMYPNTFPLLFAPFGQFIK